MKKKNKNSSRLSQTMGFFIKNATMHSSKTKDYKITCTMLQKENKALSATNSQLSQQISTLETAKADLQEQLERLKKQSGEVQDCLDLVGLKLEDIKRNFNHGLVYLVKPQCPKRIVMLTLDFKDKDSYNEIMDLGKQIL